MGPQAPPTTKLTFADFLRFPEDGLRHELIDGMHVAEPSPTTGHQTASRRIQFQLYGQLELGGRALVFDAPTDLKLSDTDVVVPDLVVVSSERRHIVGPARIDGVPDLVVEILSPSTSARDRAAKRALYERAGIPEYWIVDCDARVVEQLVLRDGAYALQGRHPSLIRLQAFPDVTVDLTQVWD